MSKLYQERVMEKKKKFWVDYPTTSKELKEAYFSNSLPEILQNEVENYPAEVEKLTPELKECCDKVKEFRDKALEKKLNEAFAEDYQDQAGSRESLKRQLEDKITIQYRRNIDRIYTAIIFFGELIQDEKEIISSNFFQNIGDLARENGIREWPKKLERFVTTLKDFSESKFLLSEERANLMVLEEHFIKATLYLMQKSVKQNSIRDIVIYRECHTKFAIPPGEEIEEIHEELKVQLLLPYYHYIQKRKVGKPTKLIRNALINVVYILLVESGVPKQEAKDLIVNLLNSHLCLNLTYKAVEGVIPHNI